jgi:hypothetical protein
VTAAGRWAAGGRGLAGGAETRRFEIVLARYGRPRLRAVRYCAGWSIQSGVDLF